MFFRRKHKDHALMAAIENLTAAIVTLNTTIDAVLAKPVPVAGVPEADVQAAADSVIAANAKLAPAAA